jgi:predicted aminopeptidase
MRNPTQVKKLYNYRRVPIKACFSASCLSILALQLTGCYVSKLAIKQNDLFNSRRPVEEVLADSNVDQKIKEKLKLIQAVVKFSKRQGLNGEGAYGYFIESKNVVVSYLVQAAHADELKSVKWWFPVVGSVPYRGYFSKEERDQKADELASEGYDVYRSGVGAFSSLGWFDDPVFLSMTKRSDSSLVHLIIHELAHRTIWIPGSVKFNENLAEYIASDLTPVFLTEQTRQGLIDAYQQKKRDKANFKVWLRNLKRELAEVYSNTAASKKQKLDRKKTVFEKALAKPPKYEVYDYVSNRTWNNASIIGASLYSPDIARFKKAQKCSGMLSTVSFVKSFESFRDSHKKPFESLDALCKN